MNLDSPAANVIRIISSLAFLAFAGAATAQPCTPSWSSLAGGFQYELEYAIGLSVAPWTDEGARYLYVSGGISWAGSVAVDGAARWDGSGWQPLPVLPPMPSKYAIFGTALLDGGPTLFSWYDAMYRYIDGSWREMGRFDDGIAAVATVEDIAGKSLWVGGSFEAIDGVPINGLARWDGARWVQVDQGVGAPGMRAAAVAFVPWDDGSGPATYVVGTFTEIAGQPAQHIARWDGERLKPAAFGLPGGISVAAVFDDGTGPALFVGGLFASAGGVPVHNIAKWDGVAWHDVGGGVTGGPVSIVYRLAAFDDGTGPALFAGGIFDRAGGVLSPGIAKWDGTAWRSLDGGVQVGSAGPKVLDMTVFDDGRGPGLFVTGEFAFAGGLRVNSIARWGCFAPPPPPCRANCTGDTDPVTGKPKLDILDFTCFQNAFALGDKSKADVGGGPPGPGGGCTADGILSIYDFVCFQNLYALGCP